ncbi:hypothetical protein [Streptomyces sp. NPDC000395]|uniref:hypothetical protein n=1 Tax=Streptomyces sp. NPDC000395 TaxID=3154252 RepID=UPI00336A91FA
MGAFPWQNRRPEGDGATSPNGGDSGMPSSILRCPSCGSGEVAQVLGDNGGVSYVCTACGHSWS